MLIINNSNDNTGNLVRYKYIDNISNTVENEEITVYSLVENSTLQDSITQLNMSNTNMSINYEFGITEGTDVEISDAIKLLNTEIMAGKGPDILILDDLPVNSYIENNVLADIKDIVASNKNTLFPGIIDAYENDGNIYQFPLTISVPILIGDKNLIEETNDLNSLLTILKEKSIQSDNRIFDYLGTPEEFIYSFYFIFENNWVDENNKINKKELTSFLENCEEIYRISKEKDDIYQEQIAELSETQIGTGYSIRTDEGNGYLPSISINEMRDKKTHLYLLMVV